MRVARRDRGAAIEESSDGCPRSGVSSSKAPSLNVARPRMLARGSQRRAVTKTIATPVRAAGSGGQEGHPGRVVRDDGARQYSGTAGRIENSQIGVFLTYATPRERTFVDCELYLPKAWTEYRDRCRQAGIGDEVEFATRPELAIRMLRRAHAAGVPAGWVSGDVRSGQPRRPHRAHRAGHPRPDPEAQGRRRPGLLRPARHQQRPDRGDQRQARTPPRQRPRVPQPHQLHRQIPPRDRRVQTTATPCIVKSH